MRVRGEGTEERRLRAVAERPAVDREAIGRAVAASAAEDPAGIPVAGLRAAVAERLGVAPGAVPEADVMAALGLLIATGSIDESGGRLTAVDQEARRAV